MKKALKWIAIIITIVIFLYAFSSSYSSQNIDHLDYVIALGIDIVPDSDNLSVSFEFANLGSFSENASSQKTEPIINTIIAPSIPNAIAIMNAYIGKQLNLSHCKVLVFSKEFAETGILDEITYLTHNIQIRPTTNVVVADGKAVKYLRRSTSSLEQVLTKYYDIFPTSSEYTGYISNIPLGVFYENILDKNSGAVSILGSIVENAEKKEESSSSESDSSSENLKSSEASKEAESNNERNSSNSDEKIKNEIDKQFKSENGSENYQLFNPKNVIIEGDRGAENIGLAVFKDDRYVGDLSTIETLCYSILKDEVDNFTITLDNPFNDSQKIDIRVSDLSQLDTDIEIYDDKPVINVKFNLTGEVIDSVDNQNTSYEKTLEEIDIALKKYLTNEFKSYLYKTAREYKTDVNAFYRFAKRKFLTNLDFYNYNWAQKYENAEFNVEFNDDIISSLIIRQNE